MILQGVREQAGLHIAKDTQNTAKPTQLGLSCHQQDRKPTWSGLSGHQGAGKG